MSEFDISNEKLEQLIDFASKKMGMDKAAFKDKIKSGELKDIVSKKSGMSPEQLRQLVSNPKVVEKLMQNPETAKLFNQLKQQGK